MQGITTDSKALNWMISKAEYYTGDEGQKVYRFAGTVQYRMRMDVQDWFTGKGIAGDDGRWNTSYSLKLAEDIDLEKRTFSSVVLHFRRGNMKSTGNTVEVLVTVTNDVLTDEDVVALSKGV